MSGLADGGFGAQLLGQYSSRVWNLKKVGPEETPNNKKHHQNAKG